METQTHIVKSGKILNSIHGVTDDLSKKGISKSRENQQQKYKFRGVDDVLNELSPLFVKHHICAIPNIIFSHSERLETKSGGSVEHSRVDAEFNFVNTEDGSEVFVRVPGQAMDSADKATNKAISAAFKYACFLLFCIPVDVEDADQTTHDIAPNPDCEKKSEYQKLVEEMELNAVDPTNLKQWAKEAKSRIDNLPEKERQTLRDLYKKTNILLGGK